MKGVALSVLLLTAWMACSNQPANLRQAIIGDTVRGKAVKIIDGDTFDLLLVNNTTERIRLHGIDSPERSQPFSKVATGYLGELLSGKTIQVVRMDKDRYGRTIGMVMVGNTNVNERMIAAGMAWHFKRYDQNADWDRLEQTARSKKLGLWADPNPVAPWEWRRQNRK